VPVTTGMSGVLTPPPGSSSTAGVWSSTDSQSTQADRLNESLV
jgi:hypothetical protein